MGSTETTRAPRILRVEVMPLDCGETAVVVELARWWWNWHRPPAGPGRRR